MASPVRGRFAPTPSGDLHLGNAWTALLAWLQVRQAGGTMVLRIEDLDSARTSSEYARGILEDLAWLGLDWDEGPGCTVQAPEPACASYYQSQRGSLYAESLQKLEALGLIYPCFCSRSDLRSSSQASHAPEGIGSYPGTCRHLSLAEGRDRKARGERCSQRFRLSSGLKLKFADSIYGLRVSQTELGDFIVYRSDRVYAYHLAVVVDDAAMRISHVLRGADLLEATFCQLALYEAFNWPRPNFTHVPMVYAPDGSPLSKSKGGLSLKTLRSRGVKPWDILGLMAFWAHWLPRPAAVTAADLVPLFDLSTLPREGIIWKPGNLREI